MNLTAYTRVSTAGQVTDGDGLETQADTITRWAEDHGHRIASWHTDEGESGSNGVATRAGLADALDAVTDGLVVARLDRLARDLILQEQLLADVRRRGGRVYSCAPAEDAYLDDDPADPSRRLIRQVLGAVAEYERAMIRARMVAGARRKAAAGGYAYGSPPYGWKAQNRELVPVPHEQDQIAIITALAAQGCSLRQICATLTASGSRARRGAWSPMTVSRILHRARLNS